MRDFEAEKNREIKNVIRKLLPQTLIESVISISGINGEKKANSLTVNERKALVKTLKGLKLTVKEFGGFDEAVITSGDHTAREAITHYDVLERFGGISYLALQLETGRTHQIRVHMSYTGHALLGDEVYAKSKTQFEKRHPAFFSGQALHAKKLTLTHPKTGERMTFECPLPEEFEKALELLRKEQNQ